MDLRIRLVASLGGMMLLLLLVASVILMLDVRRDVAEEVQASWRLANVLIRAGQLQADASPSALAAFTDLLGQGSLRHLQMQMESRYVEPTHIDSAWLDWLLPERGKPQALRLTLGSETLLIRPDPYSELQEALADSAGILVMLLLFAMTTLGLAWCLAHRALSPVRALLDGLSRLEQGEEQADLPNFKLQEFSEISNAINRLADSLAQSRAEQQRLTHRLLELQESERRELARELHDEFGQMLTAMSMTASYIERNVGKVAVSAIQESAHDLGQEARSMAIQVKTLLSRLRPHSLDGVGLLQGLHDLVNGWQQRAPNLHLEATLPETLSAIPARSGLALYRLLQEALTNVVRHSHASHCQVVLQQDQQGITLRVQDNGKGKVEKITKTMGGGLLGMRERIAMVHGQLRFQNVLSGGLCVLACLPAQGEST